MDRDEVERWLQEADVDELLELLDPFPDDRTRSYEVTTKVNNAANEGPGLIEPVGLDQGGLDGYGWVVGFL